MEYAERGLTTKICRLLNGMEMLDKMEFLVSQFTLLRTELLYEMTNSEAWKLINYLDGLSNSEKELNRLKSKVFAYAFQIKMIYGDTPLDRKLNLIKLNQFLLEHGVIKRKIEAMTRSQLLKVIDQFYLLSISHMLADVRAMTKSLIAEMHLISEEDIVLRI